MSKDSKWSCHHVSRRVTSKSLFKPSYEVVSGIVVDRCLVWVVVRRLIQTHRKGGVDLSNSPSFMVSSKGAVY